MSAFGGKADISSTGRDMTQSRHWLSQPITQFERPGYGTLSFGDQLRLALTHKERTDNENCHGNEHEREYQPTLQSFELAADPICGIAIAHCPDTRADCICKNKIAPRHQICASERPGQGSQHRHKLCEENDFPAVSQE